MKFSPAARSGMSRVNICAPDQTSCQSQARRVCNVRQGAASPLPALSAHPYRSTALQVPCLLGICFCCCGCSSGQRGSCKWGDVPEWQSSDSVLRVDAGVQSDVIRIDGLSPAEGTSPTRRAFAHPATASPSALEALSTLPQPAGSGTSHPSEYERRRGHTCN